MTPAAPSPSAADPGAELPAYAELHCLSNFTFLRGASHPHELVAQADALGYRALALTDECSVAGVVRAHVATRGRPLKLIVGAEFRLRCGLKFAALAIDRHGYGRLCRLITRGRRAAEKGAYALAREDLERAPLEQCFILWLPGTPVQPDELRYLAARFPAHLRIAVELLREGSDRERLAALQSLAEAHGIPLVASGDVHMHARARRHLQDALTAIRLRVPITQVGSRLYANGERYLRERERLSRLYPRELLEATVQVAQTCRFSLDELRYEYPRELVPEGESATSHLRKLTEAGARWRWPQGVPAAERTAIEHELELIAELCYEPYFLTVYDIVAFARRRGILCQGRGSAANSRVCYCLGVTSVDPQRGAALLFERFISRERHEPPDIDVDFEHERREEVLQYVYAKYGRERAALAATVIMYRPRSALRDLGKVFGLSAAASGRLAKVMQWWDGSAAMAERMHADGFDLASPWLRRLLPLAQQLVAFPGFPRHLSQHVGGFVISAGPLEELVPIENAAMPERTVVQWDKDDLNDLGLLKVDLLALGMLTALRRAFSLVNDYRGAHYTLGELPAEDPQVYDMVCRADTVGVFQIESRAQMAMLPRLKPRCYYDLVIEVAIVRPGPIQGDMVHPYLRRRSGAEPVEYPGEEVREVLHRTLGVPIFQEQVMQIAIVAAGFTPGEADALRRAMGAWKRTGGLDPFRERLLEGMRAKGYPQEFAQRIYQQMLGFGEYGFPQCVVGETRVIDADSGRWVSIDEIVSGRVQLKATIACDDDLRLRQRRVLAVRSSGVKPVWRLRTALGHTITATVEHPFLTMGGWRSLGKLRVGDCVAAARSLPVRGRRRWPRHQIVVLADLIAEGNLCHPSTFFFYTTAEWHCEDFVRAVEKFPNTRAVIERHRSCFSVRVRRIDRNYPAAAITWAQRLGIRGFCAREKHLPPEALELLRGNIALLLARLWDGDGSLSVTAGHASYDTASRRLAGEVQYLLLRLGIVARLYRRVRSYKGQMLTHYVVVVTGETLRLFWKYVGRRFLDPEKRRRSQVLATRRRGRMSRDIIPADVRAVIRRERERAQLTCSGMARASGLAMREICSCGGSKIGFRRFVIERLATVLRSRELERLAYSDIYWDRVVAMEELGSEATYDLQIEGDHNFLANNLIVHNSHAMSFALLVYDSAWLKCHEPAAFTCALLNSQPMGFYAPAQLVRDARAHGVEVRAVDVCVSSWDSALERREDGSPALRLGLRLVKSLSEAGAQRLIDARRRQPFASVQDLAVRAALDRGDLEALAAAGAFAALCGNRHLAFWEVAGTERALPLGPTAARAQDAEGRPLLPAPTEGQGIVADYASLGLTLGRHPLALLRGRLRALALTSAGELKERGHGAQVRTAGIVLMRQRPATASGVTFLTLEDESGQVNVIVWERVGREQRAALLESRLLEVHGELQQQEGVSHLIAHRLIDRTVLLGELLTRSRDFH
ncbi:MAG TPA: error-prone DNA polymerase [Steroidobacteraceae bacterium]|nr:error-prone DNA polymerase [Steroidobacteraceae bacterium]